MKGDSGLTPNIFVPFILGSGPGLGVRIIFPSSAGEAGLVEHETLRIENRMKADSDGNNRFFIVI